MGWRRTLAWIAIGYAIAYASEVSSIHNGFPYGYYEYLPEATLESELWIPWWTDAIRRVPFMDSLSYVFLSAAAYLMALQFLSPLRRRGAFDYQIDPVEDVRWSWRTTLLAAYLFMMLDVVIDPVAHLGERWFLGRIYWYPGGGVYFGCPLSNFAGWFLVGAAIVRSNQWLDRALSVRGYPFAPARAFPGRDLMPPGLYFGVFAFNLAVTFAIGEPLLGWVGVAIASPILVLFLATRPRA